MLPQSSSFKYLCLAFHASGTKLPAFAKLAQNGKGAAARLNAKDKALMCSKSVPMMRRMFDAVMKPTMSYGCEVWAPPCSLAMGPELKDMLGVQMAFFCQLSQLRKSVTPNIIFREFSEKPWLDTWWSFLLGFVRRLSLLPDDSMLTFSGIISWMRGAHCRAPTWLEALRSLSLSPSLSLHQQRNVVQAGVVRQSPSAMHVRRKMSLVLSASM